jgi:hypothetical protein
MGVLYPLEARFRTYRPGVYRRLETMVNDPGAQDADRKVAKLNLQMRLPQMRRDANDQAFSEAERRFISALIGRVEGWSV